MRRVLVSAPAGDLVDEELVARSSWPKHGREDAPTRVLRVVRFVDSLPRTATGKLRRFLPRTGNLTPEAPPTAGTGFAIAKPGAPHLEPCHFRASSNGTDGSTGVTTGPH